MAAVRIAQHLEWFVTVLPCESCPVPLSLYLDVNFLLRYIDILERQWLLSVWMSFFGIGDLS